MCVCVSPESACNPDSVRAHAHPFEVSHLVALILKGQARGIYEVTSWNVDVINGISVFPVTASG